MELHRTMLGKNSHWPLCLLRCLGKLFPSRLVEALLPACAGKAVMTIHLPFAASPVSAFYNSIWNRLNRRLWHLKGHLLPLLVLHQVLLSAGPSGGQAQSWSLWWASLQAFSLCCSGGWRFLRTLGFLFMLLYGVWKWLHVHLTVIADFETSPIALPLRQAVTESLKSDDRK